MLFCDDPVAFDSPSHLANRRIKRCLCKITNSHGSHSTYLGSALATSRRVRLQPAPQGPQELMIISLITALDLIQVAKVNNLAFITTELLSHTIHSTRLVKLTYSSTFPGC